MDPISQDNTIHDDHYMLKPVRCPVCVGRKAVELGLKSETVACIWEYRHFNVEARSCSVAKIARRLIGLQPFNWKLHLPKKGGAVRYA